MQNEFVPYQPSLDMKSIGFDEPCFANYNIEGILQPIMLIEKQNTNSYFSSGGYFKEICTAPTFSQAFRWFREKYNLVHEISWSKYKGGLNFDYDIFSLVLPTDDELGDEDDVASDKSMETYDSLVDKGFRHHESNTYEEAELECIKHLIKIIKNKKQ